MITASRRSLLTLVSPVRVALAFLVLVSALVCTPLHAQDAPPRQLPPASPPPTAPRTAPEPVVAPPANAVALCNDASFVVAPAQPSACAARGGLKLVLPTYRASTPADVAPGRVPVAAAVQAALTPSTPPAGATMRCKDGTWFSGTPDAARCVSNGGLAVILPPSNPPVPPPPARP